MRLLLLASLLLATSGPVAAQDLPGFDDPGRRARVAATEEAVAGMFRAFLDEQPVPGLAFGVVLDGELLYADAFGLAQLDPEVPADTRSLFRIASMSKSFTALAILQLRDADLLALDDPVARYVPEAAGLDYLTDDAPVLTIRHLLTHSGGFPEDNPWGDRQLAAPDAELRAHVAAGVSFADVPGIAYEYSNLGFALLGQIVQEVSGMELQVYMAERVFGPLGMSSTVWEYTRAPAGRLALGYDLVDGAWVHVPHEHHGAYGAMGGLITSIEDFARYAALHLGAWPPRSGADEGPLRRASLREMHQPWRFAALSPDFRYPNGRVCATSRAYAYGLSSTVDCDGRVLVAHSGGLPGFGSNWTMMPDHGLAVISFDNRTYRGTSGLNLAVLDTIVSLAGLEPRRPPVSDVLQERMDQLVALLPGWEGAEGADFIAENFFMDNRRSDLVARTRRLFDAVGPIRRVHGIVPLNRLRGSFVMEGERGSVEVFFTLSPETVPKVQQVRMRRVGG